MSFPAAIGCGAIAGLGFGMTAGGGSVLAVPLLIYVLHLPTHKAICVSMIAIGAMAFTAVLKKRRGSEMDWPAGLIIAVAGIAAAPLGAWLNRKVSEKDLLILFSATMIFVAARMFFNKASPSNSETPNDRIERRPNFRNGALVVFAAIGFTTGIAAGLLGIGGGFIIVPALVLLRGQEIHHAIATAFLSIALIAVSATTSHFLAGQKVPPTMTVQFIFGGLAGSISGIWLAKRVPGQVLQKLFAAIILLIALAILVPFK